MRFDEDADFKKRAYEAVVKLQSHDPNFIKAWTLICDESRKGENRHSLSTDPFLKCFVYSPLWWIYHEVSIAKMDILIGVNLLCWASVILPPSTNIEVS